MSVDFIDDLDDDDASSSLISSRIKPEERDCGARGDISSSRDAIIRSRSYLLRVLITHF